MKDPGKSLIVTTHPKDIAELTRIFVGVKADHPEVAATIESMVFRTDLDCPEGYVRIGLEGDPRGMA